MYSLNYSSDYVSKVEIKLDDQKFQFGYIGYKNGDRYEGYMRAGTPTGQGRLQLSTGAYYEGEFDESGLIEGVLAHPNDMYFKNVFDCDCFVEGKFVFSDGTNFDGKWNLSNDEWVVIEGQLRSKTGELLSEFVGKNLVHFVNAERTQVRIVFARCQILGNSSFYEGGFDPENQTLDGRGVLIGSTRKYSETSLRKGKKHGQWLFVNYWEDLPYWKKVEFKEDRKVRCETQYGNGLLFNGIKDFGYGTATFPELCTRIKVLGNLTGNDFVPIMSGMMCIDGEEVGMVEIREDNGKLSATYKGKSYAKLEDLLQEIGVMPVPASKPVAKKRKAREDVLENNYEPEIEPVQGQMVKSIMVSQNDPENEMRRTFTSRRSNISKTGRKSRIELMQDRRKIKEVTDSHQKEDVDWRSKITLNVSIEKKLCGSLMLSREDDKGSLICLSKTEGDLYHAKQNIKERGSDNLIEIGLGSKRRSTNATESKRKNLFEESKNENNKSSGANQIPPALDVGSDSEAEIKSVFSGRSDFEVTGGPQKRAMDLISHNGTAVNSPRNVLDAMQGGKSHFSFNHSFQELQSQEGIRVGLLDSFGSKDFGRKPSKKHMFSKVETTKGRWVQTI